jgi:putative metallohydrolase (TIGR04338 family)
MPRKVSGRHQDHAADVVVLDGDDPQRERVYAAEDDCYPGWGRRLGSLTEVRRWLGRVFDSRWFYRRYSAPGCELQVTGFRVEDDRGDGWARGWRKGSTCRLVLPAALRYEVIVCHELAHCLTWRHLPLHGREFFRTFLQLVRRFVGPHEADWLREAFVEHGVRHRLPPASRTEGTDCIWPYGCGWPG